MESAKAATPTALCNHIAAMVGVAPDKISIAKHRVEQFDWVRIQDPRKVDCQPSRGGGAVAILGIPRDDLYAVLS